MNTDKPIGIFDSGIGGLTVAHAINTLLPNEKIIYFGDTQHLPYGNKSSKMINYYSEKIVDFLLKKECKAIVIACNSASSIAFQNLLKKTTKKCILFNVIDPLIDAVVNDDTIKNVGVIGTSATISTNIYEKHIYAEKSDIRVTSLATPLLASLIEEDNQELYERGIIESYLSDKKLNNIDALILGCTHYPLIKSKISRYYNHKIKLLSILEYIGFNIKKKLKSKKLLNKNKIIPQHNFYVSDYTDNFQKNTHLFFPTAIILEEENLFS